MGILLYLLSVQSPNVLPACWLVSRTVMHACLQLPAWRPAALAQTPAETTYLGPLLLLLREAADTALRGPAPSIEQAEAEVQVHFAQGSEPETASQWVDTDLDGSLDHADLKDKTN